MKCNEKDHSDSFVFSPIRITWKVQLQFACNAIVGFFYVATLFEDFFQCSKSLVITLRSLHKLHALIWFLLPHYNGGLNLKICQNFVEIIFFLTFVGG